jgi:hypothetical protein
MIMRIKRRSEEMGGIRQAGTATVPPRSAANGAGRARRRGYSLVEAIVATFVLAITSSAFYAGLGSGFGVTKFSREEVRATQIMTQQLEAVRLCTWDQLTNYSFQQVYDPLATNNANAGVLYTGQVAITPASSIPNTVSYAPNVCLVTVSLSWTNSTGNQAIPHSRQMQTQVARYGMQSYIWGAVQ